MEKLNRAAKCSILGPQNLGSGGGPGPPGPPPGSAAVSHEYSPAMTSARDEYFIISSLRHILQELQ